MGIFSSDEFSYSDWLEEHQKVMKYKKILANIAKGKIGKYSCAEEYAMNVLKKEAKND